MARSRKATALAELKLRLPEPLRADLEHAAARNKRSMNAEMVKRLTESFQEMDKTQLIANALVKELDADILAAMFDKILAEGILSESRRGWAKPASIKEAATPSEAVAKLVASLEDLQLPPVAVSKVLDAVLLSQDALLSSQAPPSVTVADPAALPVHADEDSDDRPHPPSR